MSWRYLRNLSSIAANAGNLPWQWAHKPPAEVVEKSARTKWITDPKTQWHCYSAFDGLNENQRVSGARASRDDGNPPVLMRGLVVDYDAPWTEDGLRAGAARVDHAPGWLENTLSGNARLIWEFAEPLKLPTYGFARDWQVFMAEKLRVRMLFPGIDEGALKAPDRYFTNSGDWYDLGASALPAALVRGWFVEFVTKAECRGPEFGEEMPIEQAAELIRAKYPRFSEWEGDFVLGAQGPTFWVDGSTSPKSAIVKPGGLITFSQHASKPFYSWTDILGVGAVDSTKAKNIGEAVGNIFFDGKVYYRTIANGSWRPFEKGDLGQHLKVNCRLSVKPDKSGVSQIDQALQYIQNHQYVSGAAPFVFRKPGRVRVNGNEYLNTSVRRPMIPSEQPTVWGKDGSFPWLSQWLEHLFAPESGMQYSQLDYFRAWLAYFYQGCLAGDPVSGHNLIIAGGASTGKTLLNRRVIGAMVGGYAEAADYLMNKDAFGSELFDSAHWVVDDAISPSDKDKKVFEQILKRMSANTTFRYHAKFRIPLMVEWSGRVVVTCNADEESIRILPSLNASNLDKLQLFKVSDALPVGFFPERSAVADIIDRELPGFARWIADYKIPPHLIAGDRRFGVVPCHHTGLVQTAHHSSHVNAFQEILSDWRETYFEGSVDPCWEGTGYQLVKLMNAGEMNSPVLRVVTVQNIGQSLASLKARGYPGVSCTENGDQRIWRIERPANRPISEDKKPTRSAGKFSKKAS